MRKPDLFDEIILLLRQQSEKCPTTEISPEILDALYANAPRRAPAAQPAVAMRQPAPRPTPQPANEEPQPVRHEPEQVLPPPRPAPPVAAMKATPMPDLSKMSLDELRVCTHQCHRCILCQTRTNVVFGDGNPNAELMFIGEGPGQDEDEQGLPFVGRSGELLTRMIAAMGFDRQKDVYIANIVKCRPPENRTPTETEAKTCLPFLDRQIELIRPKVMVLLGGTPLLFLLNMRGITRLHGQWFNYRGIKVLPTFHPAYLLRDPRRKADAWKDLQVVMKEFGHEPPKKK